ncbi:MAG: hypothetical protein OEV99_00920 [Nitrospira sp.]|nr:hypothetical protein [Nitrospira sp.]MDH4368374.1 hypothetical protein [Nitrospira sp.]MDH5347545.1 hypothetical protein [Nitrospira sp.]MDH5496982.1 hypothetical protein [Nitrospira sp.]MDH5726523.1 hypothetical protein [Nitrospira sp.]
MNRQRGIAFAAVINQDIRLSLLCDRFRHQLHGIPPHLWKLFHNLGVWLRSFLRCFIGHLERCQESQHREWCGETFPRLLATSNKGLAAAYYLLSLMAFYLCLLVLQAVVPDHARKDA